MADVVVQQQVFPNDPHQKCRRKECNHHLLPCNIIWRQEFLLYHEVCGKR